MTFLIESHSKTIYPEVIPKMLTMIKGLLHLSISLDRNILAIIKVNTGTRILNGENLPNEALTKP